MSKIIYDVRLNKTTKHGKVRALQRITSGKDRGKYHEVGELQFNIVKNIIIDGEPVVKVYWIWVDPELRGQGIATGLYQNAADYACSLGMRLASDETLKPGSRGFWEKQRKAGNAKKRVTTKGKGVRKSRYVLGCPAKINPPLPNLYHGSPYSSNDLVGDFQKFDLSGGILFLTPCRDVAKEYTRPLLRAGKRPTSRSVADSPTIYTVEIGLAPTQIFDTRNPDHASLYKQIRAEIRKQDPDGDPGSLIATPILPNCTMSVGGLLPSFGAVHGIKNSLKALGFRAVWISEGSQGASLAVLYPEDARILETTKANPPQDRTHDQDRRNKERNLAQSGTVENRAALLVAQMRSGEIDPLRVLAAAGLGDEASSIATKGMNYQDAFSPYTVFHDGDWSAAISQLAKPEVDTLYTNLEHVISAAEDLGMVIREAEWAEDLNSYLEVVNKHNVSRATEELVGLLRGQAEYYQRLTRNQKQAANYQVLVDYLKATIISMLLAPPQRSNPDETDRRRERAAGLAGDVQSRAKVLMDRLRRGEISEARVALAAQLGDEAARTFYEDMSQFNYRPTVLGLSELPPSQLVELGIRAMQKAGLAQGNGSRWRSGQRGRMKSELLDDDRVAFAGMSNLAEASDHDKARYFDTLLFAFLNTADFYHNSRVWRDKLVISALLGDPLPK